MSNGKVGENKKLEQEPGIISVGCGKVSSLLAMVRSMVVSRGSHEEGVNILVS